MGASYSSRSCKETESTWNQRSQTQSQQQSRPQSEVHSILAGESPLLPENSSIPGIQVESSGYPGSAYTISIGRAGSSNTCAFTPSTDMLSSVTNIHQAAAEGDISRVRHLVKLENVDPDSRSDTDQYTPVHEACARGHLDLVKTLVDEYNASPHLASKSGVTPLHCAAIGDHGQIIQHLVETYGVPVDAKTNEGFTPLHYCSFFGHMSTALLLVEMLNASVGIKDNDGRTPLDIAKESDYSDLITYLSEKGTTSTSQQQSTGGGEGTSNGPNFVGAESTSNNLNLENDDFMMDLLMSLQQEEENLNGHQQEEEEEAEEAEGDLSHLGELERKVERLRRKKVDVEANCPDAFICPITFAMMTDPVITADGYTYEKSAIESWLQQSNRSPQTNEELEHTNMIPNRVMRSEIYAWVDQKVREHGLSPQ